MEETAIGEAQNFCHSCNFVNESLYEAEDNMKFLDGIKKQVEICVEATDFSVIRIAIKKVMKSLRHAWMLSKYYNTDEKEFLKVEPSLKLVIRCLPEYTFFSHGVK